MVLWRMLNLQLRRRLEQLMGDRRMVSSLPVLNPPHLFDFINAVNYPLRAYFPVEGRKWSSRLKPYWELFEQNQAYFLPVKIFPPRPKISCPGRRFSAKPMQQSPARTANQSPAEIPAEAGLDKKYKVEWDWIDIFFLSIPVQRVSQIEAEKIAKAGSQAHAQRR
ncbi:hypothetical protein V6N11_031751 [Hibiscus sabdariffa]|uniref:Uncharacterized protein n=1 Tax=Hibiscus sabdariffa TaxID=183260 RepID=A0ABR2SZC2_9ROSI